jgi:two-component system, chemotaxis family, chemotaxis protein CheY
MSGAAFENLRALIVEDNGHMRTLLRNLLNAIGIKDVLEAPDGGAALALLQDRQCDIILSDMAMAPMDGIAFTQRIRNGESGANPYIPIIMVTGHTERHRVEMARDAGVTEFLAKPITTQNLCARLAGIVERPRAFVRTENYFGPDRRRKDRDNYAGPWRRDEDFKDIEVRE